MDILDGVRLLDNHLHRDPRGSLVALEEHTTLPFALKRVFFMHVDDRDTVRGGHANSCDEFIVVMKGAVLIEVDNGSQAKSIRLDSYDKALWIRAGILIHLREFERGTILLVCASELYEDTRHYACARPDLMMADHRT